MSRRNSRPQQSLWSPPLDLVPEEQRRRILRGELGEEFIAVRPAWMQDTSSPREWHVEMALGAYAAMQKPEVDLAGITQQWEAEIYIQGLADRLMQLKRRRNTRPLVVAGVMRPIQNRVAQGSCAQCSEHYPNCATTITRFENVQDVTVQPAHLVDPEVPLLSSVNPDTMDQSIITREDLHYLQCRPVTDAALHAADIILRFEFTGNDSYEKDFIEL